MVAIWPMASTRGSRMVPNLIYMFQRVKSQSSGIFGCIVAEQMRDIAMRQLMQHNGRDQQQQKE